MIPSVSFAILVGALTTVVTGQWTQEAPHRAPSPRHSHAMAYDSARRQTVLFGGFTGAALPTDETWEWDGDDWTPRSLATKPRARGETAMAYDPRRNRIVLFGGRDGATVYGDTWEYDGVSWLQRNPATRPPARSFHALAYDPVFAVTVMFGGNGATGQLADTWIYDGNDWRSVPVTNSPPPTSGHGMFFDPAFESIVVAPGGTSTGLGWRLIYAGWHSFGLPFPGRSAAAVGVDGDAESVVVFGGTTGSTTLGDTWYGNASSWTQASPGPGMRERVACAASNTGVVLFGGLSGAPLGDTWTFATPIPVFPESAARVAGNERFDNLLNIPVGRVQTIMERDGFPPSFRSGSIRGLRLRREAGTTTLTGRTVSLLIRIGAASRTAETMSTRFTDNWQGSPTGVFLGQVDVPTSGPARSPAPFEVRLPFSAPFAWTNQDLAVELYPQGTTSFAPWPVDAVSQPFPIGTVQAFGQACRAPSGRTPSYVLPDPRDLAPGGRIASGLRDATAGAVAFTILGDSDTSWAGLPLPFTFPGTGCTIYNNLVVSPSAVVDATGSAATDVPIANNPSLGGLRLFGQWAVLEGPSANPPVTLTQAARMQLGRVVPVFYDSIVNFDGSTVGQKTARKYSSLVFRLDL